MCHAWFVFWVCHVLSSRVVLHRVPQANVFCGCVWYEAWLYKVISFHVATCRAMYRVMPCHVASRHVTSRHVTARHGTARHVTACHVMSCHVMSCQVMSCHVMSCYVSLCSVISARVTFGSSSGILSRPFFSCHVASSCHF